MSGPHLARRARLPRVCRRARGRREPRGHRDDARPGGRLVAAAAAGPAAARLRIPRLRARGLGGVAGSRLDGDAAEPPRSSPASRGASPTCGAAPTATSRSRTAWRPRSRRDSAPARGSPSSPTARGSPPAPGTGRHPPGTGPPAPGPRDRRLRRSPLRVEGRGRAARSDRAGAGRAAASSSAATRRRRTWRGCGRSRLAWASRAA